MASEEENFELDVYGDGNMTYSQDAAEEEETKAEDVSEPTHTIQVTPTANSTVNGPGAHQEIKLENGHSELSDIAQKIASTDDSTQDVVHLPKQAPQAQGLKRKDGFDDRTVDPGATTALFISDLHWWVTDDDIRGWANQSGCEDEFVDVTFSEHKVNGKSKGQAYALFKSPQAATAVKQKVESLGKSQKYRKKFTVYYTSPLTNPFHTLPKEGTMRVSNNPANSNHPAPGSFRSTRESSTIPIQQTGFHVNTSSGGYRGRGGGNNNRGVGMNNMPNYNRGGFQQSMTGGFQATPMGGFQGTPMVGMPPYGGFQNRGGPMMGGIRGGRGGMSPAGGMMGMQMGNMGMGAMGAQLNGLGMAMPQMGSPMVMPGQVNFQGAQAQYHPVYYQQPQPGHPNVGVGDSTWNPHGAKRTRRE